eukprot:g75864.t1
MKPNPRKAWAILRRFLGKESDSPRQIENDGGEVVVGKDAATVFAEQYYKQLNRPTNLPAPPTHKIERVNGGSRARKVEIFFAVAGLGRPVLPGVLMARQGQRLEFQEVFQESRKFGLKASENAQKGLLRASSIRSMYWKLFLGLLPSDSIKAWHVMAKLWRQEYERLKQENMVAPETAQDHDLGVNNPLSTSHNSSWQKFFQDKDLVDTIKLDLKRTHPSHDFFQSSQVQEQMLNILFIWSKVNPKYSYRQGMNELLSPLLLVVSRDHRAWAEGAAQDSPGPANESERALVAVLEPAYVEHDTYMLFREVMCGMAQFFVVTEKPKVGAKREQAGGLGEDAPPASPASSADTPIVRDAKRIHHTLLQEKDPALYRKLSQAKVEPTVYLLRWVRLLFAREFHIEDVCVVWDAILAVAKRPIGPSSFQLVECVSLSMLFYIRQQLLDGDDMFVMKRLLKFPPVEDISAIVVPALLLHNPNNRLFQGTALPQVARSRLDPLTAEQSGAGDSTRKSAKSLYKVSKFLPLPGGGGNARLTPEKGLDGSGLETATGAVEDPATLVSQLKRQVRDQQIVMHEMGKLVDNALNAMHAEYTLSQESNGAEGNFEEAALNSFATLKHVRDALLGRLELAEVRQGLEHKQRLEQQEVSPTKPAHATGHSKAGHQGSGRAGHRARRRRTKSSEKHPSADRARSASSTTVSTHGSAEPADLPTQPAVRATEGNQQRPNVPVAVGDNSLAVPSASLSSSSSSPASSHSSSPAALTTPARRVRSRDRADRSRERQQLQPRQTANHQDNTQAHRAGGPHVHADRTESTMRAGSVLEDKQRAGPDGSSAKLQELLDGNADVGLPHSPASSPPSSGPSPTVASASSGGARFSRQGSAKENRAATRPPSAVPDLFATSASPKALFAEDEDDHSTHKGQGLDRRRADGNHAAARKSKSRMIAASVQSTAAVCPSQLKRYEHLSVKQYLKKSSTGATTTDTDADSGNRFEVPTKGTSDSKSTQQATDQLKGRRVKRWQRESRWACRSHSRRK